MSESAGPVSERTRVRRSAKRGVYDREAIHAILDEALVCHVGFVDEGQPYVLPTIYARIGERIYLHGSLGNRMLRLIASGVPACITVTLVDGLVLARSAFHHSMNYRSVVILGKGTEVTDPEEKQRAFDALVEHVVPGRMLDVRGTNEKERAGTMLVSFPIDESSAKSRTGPPVDDEGDYDLPVWAGVIPLALTAGSPIADPRLPSGIEAPEYARAYGRKTR